MHKTNFKANSSHGKLCWILAVGFLAGIQASNAAEPIELQIDNGNIFGVQDTVNLRW